MMNLFSKKDGAEKRRSRSVTEMFMEQKGIEGLKGQERGVKAAREAQQNADLMQAAILKNDKKAIYLYMSALIEQNWLMMNQMEEIKNELKEANGRREEE